MENYEQKYKEALNWIRSIYPTMQGADKEDAEHHFPELKETEDGKIRKEIIEYITRYKDCITDKEYDSWIAWLEKQGEQKPNHWKPSNEQMQALFEAKLASTKNREYFLGLLYKDLKKL